MIFKTVQQYKAHYFPKNEFERKLHEADPAEFGKYLVDKAFNRIRQDLKMIKLYGKFWWLLKAHGWI